MVPRWFHDGIKWFQDGSRMVTGWFQDNSRMVMMVPGWFLFGKDKLLKDPRLYKGLDGLVTIPDLHMFLHAEISPRIE